MSLEQTATAFQQPPLGLNLHFTSSFSFLSSFLSCLSCPSYPFCLSPLQGRLHQPAQPWHASYPGESWHTSSGTINQAYSLLTFQSSAESVRKKAAVQHSIKLLWAHTYELMKSCIHLRSHTCCCF